MKFPVQNTVNAPGLSLSPMNCTAPRFLWGLVDALLAW